MTPPKKGIFAPEGEQFTEEASMLCGLFQWTQFMNIQQKWTAANDAAIRLF